MSAGLVAVEAVRSIRRWGLWAAARFAARRGVPLPLFLLAWRLECQTSG